MITVITETRQDAIGVTSRNLIRCLREFGEINVIETDPGPRRGFSAKPIELLNAARVYLRVPKNDVLLFMEPKRVQSLLGLLARNRKAVIVHHLDPEPWYRRVFPCIRVDQLLSRFDRLICVSEFPLEQLEELGLARPETKVAYQGVDPNVFLPTDERIAGLDEPYVLHLGSEIPRKNIANLMAAFRVLADEFPRLRLVRCGAAGSASNRKATLLEVEKHRLQDRVLFTDRVPEEDLRKYYSGARLFLLPSLMEGFGFPVVEAMACGCPVVTSDQTPLKQIAGETQLLIDPRDPADIAAKCRLVLLDDAVRERMSRDGVERSKLFRWEEMARVVFEILQELQSPT